jgi:hypothetical protein
MTEVARWISPFRRKEGNWVTDITPYIGLFTTSPCTFFFSVYGTLKPWKANVEFIYYNETQPDLEPFSIHPLYTGGAFNSKYNAQFQPFFFTLPPTFKKVEIVALITGHGSDENFCCEFCVSSHHFVINNQTEFVDTFSEAGTAFGCTYHVPRGALPNEHGTWLYGRGGWCDGQQVDPWVIDITSNVNAMGQNFLRYFGYYQGKDPNPTKPGAYIIMSSYLVIWN